VTIFLLGIAVLAVVTGIVIFHLIPAAEAYVAYRGKRLVTCPENKQKAAVEVAAARAAASLSWGEPKLRLNQCSRWPERQGCGQDCLQQIEAHPENCLLLNIVSSWYEGRKCFFCHKPFTRLRHLDHAPALMDPDHITAEWKQFRPEQIIDVLSTSEPVCWSCHIAETFRRTHPELVVERNRHVHHLL
jgi:hypothetical protein